MQSTYSMQSLIKLAMAFFTEQQQKILTISMEIQKTPNSQSDLEKKNEAGGIRPPDFRLYCTPPPRHAPALQPLRSPSEAPPLGGRPACPAARGPTRLPAAGGTTRLRGRPDPPALPHGARPACLPHGARPRTDPPARPLRCLATLDALRGRYRGASRHRGGAGGGRQPHSGKRRSNIQRRPRTQRVNIYYFLPQKIALGSDFFCS